MKIALVGIGKIARDQHVPAIAASPDWELAATVSRHGQLAGVQAFDNLPEMLKARPDIEVVSLCMPPVPRFAAAAEVLRSRRHVMLEKPPGATLAECHALEAMARKTGVSIFATWHSREAAAVAPAKDWLKDKRLKLLTVTWKENVRQWHPGQQWIWEAGGLGVFDPGINALSILTLILPDAVHVASAILSFPENCATPIAASLSFAHPHGAEVTAEFDFRQLGNQTWTIMAEADGHVLTLERGGATLTIDGVLQTSARDEANPLGGEYPRLYEKLARLVQAGGIDMDLRPMVLVSDAFLIGKRVTVEPFLA